jgi:hypothetical protein
MQLSSGLAPIALALLALACGKRPAAPQADPAEAKARAERIYRGAPNTGSVPACTDADITGLMITQTSLMGLAGRPLDGDPEHAPWINPPGLDDASVRTLLDPAAAPAAKREAAAAFLAAPGYLVYRIDNLDAPLAIGVKEHKVGTVGGRVLRHDGNGRATCFRVFNIQNTKDKITWAIQQSTTAVVAPEIVSAMQADLAAQYQALVPRPGAPAPVQPAAPSLPRQR